MATLRIRFLAVSFVLAALSSAQAFAYDCNLSVKLRNSGIVFDDTVQSGSYAVDNWQQCFVQGVQVARKWPVGTHYVFWDFTGGMKAGFVDANTPTDYPKPGEARTLY